MPVLSLPSLCPLFTDTDAVNEICCRDLTCVMSLEDSSPGPLFLCRQLNHLSDAIASSLPSYCNDRVIVMACTTDDMHRTLFVKSMRRAKLRISVCHHRY